MEAQRAFQNCSPALTVWHQKQSCFVLQIFSEPSSVYGFVLWSSGRGYLLNIMVFTVASEFIIQYLGDFDFVFPRFLLQQAIPHRNFHSMFKLTVVI